MSTSILRSVSSLLRSVPRVNEFTKGNTTTSCQAVVSGKKVCSVTAKKKVLHINVSGIKHRRKAVQRKEIVGIRQMQRRRKKEERKTNSPDAKTEQTTAKTDKKNEVWDGQRWVLSKRNKAADTVRSRVSESTKEPDESVKWLDGGHTKWNGQKWVYVSGTAVKPVAETSAAPKNKPKKTVNAHHRKQNIASRVPRSLAKRPSSTREAKARAIAFLERRYATGANAEKPKPRRIEAGKPYREKDKVRVNCPDCGREMSRHVLRYDHKRHCSAIPKCEREKTPESIRGKAAEGETKTESIKEQLPPVVSKAKEKCDQPVEVWDGQRWVLPKRNKAADTVRPGVSKWTKEPDESVKWLDGGHTKWNGQKWVNVSGTAVKPVAETFAAAKNEPNKTVTKKRDCSASNEQQIPNALWLSFQR